MRRVDLHARAAEVIERRHRDDRAPRLTEVAHHLWEAGTDPGQGPWTTRSRRGAMRVLAFEEAVNHFTRCVDSLAVGAPGSAVARCDVLLQLLDAQLATGQTKAARTSLENAASLARRVGAPDRLALAALAVGVTFAFGVLDDLEIGLLRSALNALPESEKRLRARVLARLARALVLTPDLERRTRLSAQAVALAREVDDPEVLGWVLLDQHVAIWGFTPAEEQLEVATRIVDLATQTNDHALLVRGHVLRLANLMEIGDIAGFSAEIHIYAHVIHEHGMTELRWHVPLLRATEAHIAGRLAEAERLAQDGLAMGRCVDDSGIGTWHLAVTVLLKIWAGRGEEIEALAVPPAAPGMAGRGPYHRRDAGALRHAAVELATNAIEHAYIDSADRHPLHRDRRPHRRRPCPAAGGRAGPLAATGPSQSRKLRRRRVLGLGDPAVTASLSALGWS